MYIKISNLSYSHTNTNNNKPKFSSYTHTMEMAQKVTVMVVLILVGLAGISIAMEVCGVDEDGLTACKPWVTKPCPAEMPPAACCNKLSNADFDCFCKYKNSMLLSSFGIDSDLALALPVKCNIPNTPTCST
ncbi:hypothetical protein Csa_016013 [Cucumis sativus]|nr:hypothetical protein Csa_016013 [Cucumis sativus]